MADQKPGIIQGFKDFVMRGNVLDLAVAVVVGAAFSALVKAFTDYIINPIIAAAGGADTQGVGFTINGQFVDIGAVFGALIAFLITMLVVYFAFVLPINKARELAKISPKAAESPEDVVLLREIRDLLAGRTPGAGGPTS
jgi:large conductance mechanosensitive channel